MISLPVFVQLFGPVQADGKETNVYGTTYVFIGDALSASTKSFRFSAGMAPVESAIWRLIWTPNTAAASSRLIHADAGPSNIVQIGELFGTSSANPINQQFDFTSIMNDLINKKVDKQIGFQHKDDNNLTSSIYESRLELVFRV